MFVALETSREVAVVDAHGRWEVFRIDVGRAPQGLTVSRRTAQQLFVNNFMDRTVGVFDLQPLLNEGNDERAAAGARCRRSTSSVCRRPCWRGKQFFYDARDVRISRDSYLKLRRLPQRWWPATAATWDFASLGEVSANTITLRGRGGVGRGACTGPPTSTRCRTSRASSGPWGWGPAS